jgi:hypothetical protein
MKTEVSSHGPNGEVKVSKIRKGKSDTVTGITVTSDKFAVAARALYDSRAQERIAMGEARDTLVGHKPSEVAEVRGTYGKLAASNVVLAIRLWRAGIAECNDYIRNTAFEKGITVTVKVPKILDGEWTCDERGNIIGGHASGGMVRTAANDW